MTKQEQIEEMTKIIQHEEEIYPCEDDVIVRIAFALYKNTAEKLYNAGYRKIRETNETLEEQIKHLNTIVERLDELLGKGINDYIMGIDGVEGLKDMWERSAVREFTDKVKAKSYVNNYCREVVEIDKIDELLKEYE